jgi:hypothetical protein
MGKRELIDTGDDKRYQRREEGGEFSESDDQEKSLRKDVQQHAETEVESGYGDKGDQKRDD